MRKGLIIIAVLIAMYIGYKKFFSSSDEGSTNRSFGSRSMSLQEARAYVKSEGDRLFKEHGGTYTQQRMNELIIHYKRVALYRALYDGAFGTDYLSTSTQNNLKAEMNRISNIPSKMAEIEAKVQNGEYSSDDEGLFLAAAYNIAYWLENKEFKIK